MKIKYSRIVIMGVMGIFSVLLFALALAQSVAATTIGTNVSTVDITATGNTTLGDATSDTLTIQGATALTTAATDTLNVLTGNLKVGNGTPDVSLNGENFYTEGSLEVDGASRFDGNVTLGDTADTDTVTFTGYIQGASPMVFEGATANTSETTFSFTEPTADRTITFQNNSGLVALGTAANTLFFTTTADTTVTLPTTGTLITLDGTEILTNKTLTSPTIQGTVGAGTGLTLPAFTASGTITGSGALTVTPAAAAALTLGTTGAGNTTSITLATDSTGDGEVVLPTDSISTGEILDNTITATDLGAVITFADADFIDFAAILHDDTTAQGLRIPNVGASPTDITGTNEGYIAWDQTNNRLLINDGSSWGTVVGATTTLADNTADALDIQEGTNNYINVNTADAGAVVQFGNATTNPSFSFLGSGSVTTTGSLLARATTDITTASNEALTLTADGTGDIILSGDADTDVVFSGLTNDIVTATDEALTIVPAGTGDLIVNTDADTNIQVTASAAPGVDMIAVTNTGQGATAANIDTFQVDLATATGAGANNSALHANILNAPIDASDVINGLEVTSAAQTVASTTLNLAFLDPASSGNTAGTLNALKIDSLTAGDATEIAISIGSGWDTDLNFVDTSPIISIGSGGTLVINDGTATNNLISLADAGAISIGSTNVGTTAISLVTDSTGDAEVVLPGSSVSASEIADISRTVNLPLGSWFAASESDGTAIRVLDADESGNTNEPNIGGIVDGSTMTVRIIYDVTTVDRDYIVNSFRVPADYASGGNFQFSVLPGAATATQTESIAVEVYRQQDATAADTAASTLVTTNIANNTNVQNITVTPVETYAAGDTISVRARQENASADDVTNILGIEFQYTATQ